MFSASTRGGDRSKRGGRSRGSLLEVLRPWTSGCRRMEDLADAVGFLWRDVSLSNLTSGLSRMLRHRRSGAWDRSTALSARNLRETHAAMGWIRSRDATREETLANGDHGRVAAWLPCSMVLASREVDGDFFDALRKTMAT
nr:hypothetical protein CFP56_72522 [Quercus suber]